MRFYLGLHHPHDAGSVSGGTFISVARLRRRKSDFRPGDWIMDSGAFSTIRRHGGYPLPPSEYVDQILRWSRCGNLLAAVTQDWMCEPAMLAITGKTVAEHQRLTVDRYLSIWVECQIRDIQTYIMPVLQGYRPEEYVEHIAMYGNLLGPGAWVGVGSVCKRNGDPLSVAQVLLAIKAVRPDLRLHGFGLKSQALGHPVVVDLLESADSMAWSYAARREGRGKDANSIWEACLYKIRLENRIAELDA